MDIQPFFTERYFAAHEFRVAHTLCASDCETMTIGELLQLAGEPVSALLDLGLGYTESAGSPRLRERVAATYRGVAADEVLGLAAPEEGIFLAVHALLEPGDRAVVIQPSYDSLRNLIEHVGATLEPWHVEPTEGGWTVDVERLEQLLSVPARLVVVNFPHNPTGHLPDADSWQRIVEVVTGSGAWLMSDEMYRGLERKPVDRLASACELSERTITLGGLSKTHGLPGLRTGWLVIGDPALRARVERWKDYTSICSSAPSERLAEVALAVDAELARRSVELIAANRAIADRFFARFDEQLEWRSPAAGPVGLARLRSGSADSLCRQLLEECSTLVLPATGLGLDDDRHLRFGLGRRSFAEALERLQEVLARV